MTFQVTYRGKDGKQTAEDFEAESREALFDVLSKRGISAIRVGVAEKRSRSRMTALGVGTVVGGVLALLVVAAGIYVVKNLGSFGDDGKADSPPRPARIAEATPALSPVASEGLAEASIVPSKGQKPLTSRERQLKEIREKFGDDIPENLKATVYFLEHPPVREFKVKGRTDYLRHPSERQIAGVALVEPGTFFVVKPEFGESFDRDFQNSLTEEIDINDDDSDETRAVKEGVTNLKREIAEICKREGKKPSEVMNEHAASMYELGQYQRELETELDRIHMNPEYSDKDVEDFCEAANELLKSKGLAPIPHIDLTRRSFRISSYQRMAERKAERERAKEKAKERAE